MVNNFLKKICLFQILFLPLYYQKLKIIDDDSYWDDPVYYGQPTKIEYLVDSIRLIFCIIIAIILSLSIYLIYGFVYTSSLIIKLLYK